MKKILFVIVSIILLFTIQITSFSFEGEDEIWNNLDDATKEYLGELGIDEVSFEDLFEITPSRVLKFLFDMALGKGISIIDKVILIFITLIVSSIATSFLKESKNIKRVVDYVCVLIIISFLMESISRIFIDAAASIKNSTLFINAYLPIMTGMLIASKSPALAITYNSFSIFLSNVISVFADKIFIPLISSMFAFNIISSFAPENFQARIVKTIRKLIVIILTLFSTVYSGILTTQSILASSSDSIALKGIRFVSGTFIPVVGGNVGDAISSVLSSFLIMKNSLGVFIIVVILLVNVPVIIELLIWYFVLELCSVISSMLSLDNITEVIDSLASTISLLNIILFFITFVLIISTGIIIVMGKQ